ncbi:senescence regulator [Actinidia rufa]|uniref:Senescence regulator n=1 Tax=Actinidia rufa TaxID=165716 RepID=A0A7J0GQQ1_9ERIC|nr:senescence regulator [Actinidia rufa]GFZ13140.1 senescence regulator [Actinidia rufa]
MATSKTYFARPSHRFLSIDPTAPIASDSVYELDESDVWNSSPEHRNPAPISRLSRKSAARRGGTTPVSLPVNVPDGSKIRKEDCQANRRWDGDVGDDSDGRGGSDRIPPHEFLARTRMASLSVHEGVGRTLKGRDLRSVRNAIWEKTGFQD